MKPNQQENVTLSLLRKAKSLVTLQLETQLTKNCSFIHRNHESNIICMQCSTRPVDDQNPFGRVDDRRGGFQEGDGKELTKHRKTMAC